MNIVDLKHLYIEIFEIKNFIKQYDVLYKFQTNILYIFERKA